MGRRRFPKDRKLGRKAATRRPRLKLIIVCEGANTEPHYLKEFAHAHRNELVEIDIVPAAGVPFSVVDKCVSHNKGLKRLARKSGDSFAEAYEVWGVFDIDEHPRIADTKARARDTGVHLAISNPCIELWALLHFGDQDAHIHRHDLQRRLTTLMPGYEHNKRAIFDYAQMRPNYAEALQRSKRLRKRRSQADDAGGNPSTDLDLLLELIAENGR